MNIGFYLRYISLVSIIFALFITNQSYFLAIEMESKPQTFLQVPPNSDFSVHNIPFGVFSTVSKPSDIRCASRIGKPFFLDRRIKDFLSKSGDFVIDLRYLESTGVFAKHGELFAELYSQKRFVFCESALNEFMRLGIFMLNSHF